MQNNLENLNSPSSQTSIFSETISEQGLLDSSLFEGFYESRNQMAEFIQTLDDKGESPIGDMIYNFCGKFKAFQMTPKSVSALLEKRIQRMLKNRKKKKNWNSQDSKIILWSVSKYMQRQGIMNISSMTQQDWKNIAKLIPGTTFEDCMFKILNLKKTRLSDKKWTSKQSQLLLDISMKYRKKSWRKIAQKLYLKNEDPLKIFRNAKQCKEHWTCYLNPELKKGSWDKSEDKVLFSYILKNEGRKKWSDLTKIVKGRTQNALKNRYNLIIQRESQTMSSNNELEIIESYLKKLQFGIKKQESLKVMPTGSLEKQQNIHQVQKEDQGQINPQNICALPFTYVMPTFLQPQQYQNHSVYPALPQSSFLVLFPSNFK